MQSPKVRFDQIKHPTRRAITNDNVIDEDAKALGAHIRLETGQHESEQGQDRRLMARVARAADAAGIALPARISKPLSFLRGIEIENECRRQHAEADTDAPDITAGDSGGDARRLSNWEQLLPDTAASASAGDARSATIYTLETTPDPVPTAVRYWSLWAQVEKISPRLSRHALTQKNIGCHPMPTDMTPDQLAQMISVFAAILRDARKVTA